MKKNIFAICMVTAAGCMATLTAQTKGAETLVPLTERVNVQADSARIDQIIDGRWVAVGAKKKHAIQRDFTCLFNGKPSYRFELRREDNTLEGYGKGETKGRAELSIVMPLRRILTDCRRMLTGKRKLRKPYIITEKASVRKGLRAIMSFPYISRLIWTAMCPPFLPNGTACPTARLCRLLRVK